MKNSLTTTTNLLTVPKANEPVKPTMSERENHTVKDGLDGLGARERGGGRAEGGYSYNSNRPTAKQTTKFTRQRCRRRSCCAADVTVVAFGAAAAAVVAAAAAVAVAVAVVVR